MTFLLDPHAKMPNMNLSRIEAGDIAAYVAKLKEAASARNLDDVTRIGLRSASVAPCGDASFSQDVRGTLILLTFSQEIVLPKSSG